MKKYIVAYVIEKSLKRYRDRYKVFVDGTSKQNRKAAKKFYKKLLKDDRVYTANICLIEMSTDY